MSDFIPVNIPLIGEREKEYVNDCLDTGWISSEGPYVEKFEAAFARQVNRKYAITVTNGSMALEAAVAALRLGPGDEVIMPAFTIISCASAIVKAGATPVLVDCEAATACAPSKATTRPSSRPIRIFPIGSRPFDPLSVSTN